MQYELYKKDGQWRWRAANNEIVASGEGYNNKNDCQHAVGLLMDTNRQTPFYEVTA